jgi:hypothetical protein
MPYRLRKPIVRELDSVLVQGRTLVIRMRRDGVEVKRKGERWNPTAYFVPWQSLYTTGARLRAIENARERAARRAARRWRRP